MSPGFLCSVLFAAVLYLLFGVLIFTTAFSLSFIDAFYFCIVSITSVGYGDVLAETAGAKVFAAMWCFFGMAGVVALAVGALHSVLSNQETLLLDALEHDSDKSKEKVLTPRKRVAIRIIIALSLVGVQVAVGATLFTVIEEKSFIDAVFGAVAGALTIGWGDVTFKTPIGRVLGAVWLLFSTATVAWALSALTSVIVESEQRRVARSVISQKLTTEEELEADTDNDGHVSEAEWVLLKLRQLGRLNVVEAREMLEAYKRNAEKSSQSRREHNDGTVNDEDSALEPIPNNERSTLLEKPESERTARWYVNYVMEGKGRLGDFFEWFIIVLIVIAVLGFVLSTVPTWYEKQTKVFEVVEWSCTILFSVEYVLRVWSCMAQARYARLGPFVGRLRYVITPTALIDLVAILPTWIGLLPQVDDVQFTIALRGLRLVRVLKVERYNEALAICGRVLKQNSALLLTSLSYALVLLLLSSTVFFYTERFGPSKVYFNSVPAAMWPSLLMLTGEFAITDLTGWGQFFAGLVAILAVALFSVPTGVLTAGFVTAMKEVVDKEQHDVPCPKCGTTVNVFVVDDDL